MKLRLFLVLIITYICMVFGWWLYSFIDYTKKEFSLENNTLKLHALEIRSRIVEYLENKRLPEDSGAYQTYLRNRQEISALQQNLNSFYGTTTILSIQDSTAGVNGLLSVNASPEEYQSINKTFIKKQRAFYSEVIFFSILVVSGVIWVFNKLESLLNLNKMQNNFLLSVTHEFKTPITAIKLSSQTLQHRKIDQETQMQVTNQIINNSDRLNELLDNVLLATRIDGNSYDYNMSETDLRSLIRRVAAQILTPPQFNGKFIFEEPPVLVMGDEISLRLVFSNLFQNAVKYAGHDAEIRVTFEQEEDKLKVKVTDNGKTLEPAEYKAIFNKFYRVGDENIRETKGAGLGLYLVREILKSHRAVIKASAAEPRGTVFTITFKQK